MEHKNREQENQFTVWMSASIMLHLLIILVAFFWYLDFSLRNLFSRKKALSPTQQQQKDSSIPQKKEDSLVYTLIPGRKAITESQQTSKETKEQESKTEPIQQESKEQNKQEQTPIDLTKRFTIPKPKQQRLENIKKQLTQAKDHLKEEETEKKASTSTNEPTVTKKKVSLEDLKLGFAKFLNEGNNDVLLQHGNTNKTPDAQSLRLITYNQQIARTMKEHILTHSQYDQLKDIRGKSVNLIITLERNGKQVSMKILQPSGHTLLDKVTEESLHQIKLYPPVPKHIEQDPYTMRWNLLF